MSCTPGMASLIILVVDFVIFTIIMLFIRDNVPALAHHRLKFTIIWDACADVLNVNENRSQTHYSSNQKRFHRTSNDTGAYMIILVEGVE